MLLLLLLLAVAPFFAHRVARRRFPQWRACITGIALGCIVSPLSIGIYATFYLPYVGLVPGLIGLASSMFHGAPGYEAAIAMGVIPSHHVVAGVEHIYVFWLNALVWALVYGAIGRLIDLKRLRKNSAAPRDIAV